MQAFVGASCVTWGNFGYPREAGNTSVCFKMAYWKLNSKLKIKLKH